MHLPALIIAVGIHHKDFNDPMQQQSPALKSCSTNRQNPLSNNCHWIQNGIGGTLQQGQLVDAEDAGMGGPDRGGHRDGLAVVEGDGRVQHPLGGVQRMLQSAVSGPAR
ncbi:hypothetical protein M2158_004966 [Streptomyces sp. SAI-144]|uniref:hypothetical protein n=1 Tax=Streptomyces sp. SAI-144 TaxID=2940544 RepID=UPI002476F3C7|nr:hypothetical protein [Streptomyces sp. SAI-144]MDH6436426.1 hypothetical protein [Streptomyces sp. SAI-144]